MSSPRLVARPYADAIRPRPGEPVALVATGTHDGRAGEVVVATAVDGRVLPAAPLVAAELARAGVPSRLGMASTAEAHAPSDGAELHAVLDAQTAEVIGTLADNPLAVVLCGFPEIPAAAEEPLLAWAAASGAHEVLLAASRSFCAGVERAIETVERAVERYGPPVYVRRQIVHNLHVVRRLESLGAVFVEEIGEVPDGATVVLAAHGVSPAVRSEAASRENLNVIDATCPLVAKVHHEARRFAANDYQLVLIGHADHEEIEGTLGEAPGRFHLVERACDVEALDLDPVRPVAYLTQTTLATDETAEVVAALRHRFPEIAGPPTADICYATENRQDAVRSLASQCDLILVVGSANSSNTARLVEVARREGCRAELVEDSSELRLGWLEGVATIGITAGASAPDSLVQDLVSAIALLGPVSVAETEGVKETTRFSLPTQVR